MKLRNKLALGVMAAIVALTAGVFALYSNFEGSSLNRASMVISSIHVYCPTGYWRKSNVDIVCEQYGFQKLSTLADLRKVFD